MRRFWAIITRGGTYVTTCDKCGRSKAQNSRTQRQRPFRGGQPRAKKDNAHERGDCGFVPVGIHVPCGGGRSCVVFVLGRYLRRYSFPRNGKVDCCGNGAREIARVFYILYADCRAARLLRGGFACLDFLRSARRTAYSTMFAARDIRARLNLEYCGVFPNTI